jgi:hypothetical protein
LCTKWAQNIYLTTKIIVVVELPILAIMAEYEEIANISAPIDRHTANRAGTKILSPMRLPCFACHSRLNYSKSRQKPVAKQK